jgi:hypothetical protein
LFRKGYFNDCCVLCRIPCIIHMETDTLATLNCWLQSRVCVERFDYSNLFRRYQFRTIIHQSLVPLDLSFKSSNNDNHRPSKTRETSPGPSKASEEPCEVTLPQGKPRPLTNKKTDMVACGKKRGRAPQVPHKTGNGLTMAPLEKKDHTHSHLNSSYCTSDKQTC